jgi:FlaA1/EpsC-like NDP-sugar epimerase
MPRVFADPLRERAARFAVILSLDGACSAAALGAAMVLRFEEGIPSPYPEILPVAVALLVASRVGVNVATRLHRWSFRLSGLSDAVRLATAAVGGSALFVPLSWLLVPPGLPRTVYALEFFLSSTAFAVLRFGPRVALRWWGELRRRRPSAERTLVVGVTFAAEQLARDVVRSLRSPYDVVGFVGSDASEVGLRLDGKPVLGVVEELGAVVARHRVRTVMLAIPRPAAARLRDDIAACAMRGVRFKILPACASLAEPVSAAMLDDLAPEDLLARAPVAPDRKALRRRVAGRRALVTGAAGDIGAEICRHLVHHGLRQLVMVDAAQDPLYARGKRLAEEQPDADVRAEVADRSDPERLARLVERYRPDFVFHAAPDWRAAAPERTAEGELRGTLEVARTADLCGAQRFVLVSCEGAGDAPEAGAPTRGADRVLRDLPRSGRMKVTAVRVGDVLGPGGCVLRLLEEQPAAPGSARRERAKRLLTLPEAAGLVLVAGLGDGREPSVLAGPGRPVQVDELARLAVALARSGAPAAAG